MADRERKPAHRREGPTGDVEVFRAPVRDGDSGVRPARRGRAAVPPVSRRRAVPVWALGAVLLVAPLALVIARGWRHRGEAAMREQTGVAAASPAGEGRTTRAAAGEVLPAESLEASQGGPGAVSRFTAWTSDEVRVGLPAAEAHRVAEGIALLADALDETASVTGASEGDRLHVAAIRAHAGQLRRTHDDRARAALVAKAFGDAAVMITELQGGSAAARTDLMISAAAIAPERPLSAQLRAVRGFFLRSAAALQALSPGAKGPRSLGR